VNTDRLIDVLSTNLEPVNRVQLGKALALAMVVGGAAAFGLILTTVGPRSHFELTPHLEWTAAKLFFALSIICTQSNDFGEIRPNAVREELLSAAGIAKSGARQNRRISPRGHHPVECCIRPSELIWRRSIQLQVHDPDIQLSLDLLPLILALGNWPRLVGTHG
jgi:Negative regulator of sigma F